MNNYYCLCNVTKGMKIEKIRKDKKKLLEIATKLNKSESESYGVLPIPDGISMRTGDTM